MSIPEATVGSVVKFEVMPYGSNKPRADLIGLVIYADKSVKQIGTRYVIISKNKDGELEINRNVYIRGNRLSTMDSDPILLSMAGLYFTGKDTLDIHTLVKIFHEEIQSLPINEVPT
jgi:hypothetical protein